MRRPNSDEPTPSTSDGAHETNDRLPSIDTLRKFIAGLGAGETSLHLRGPLFESVAAPDIARIRAFRNEQYRERLQYLLSPKQQELEERLDIDARSAHFSAESNGHVIGAVRITPAPFEFESLSSSLASAAPHVPRHVELSRLVVTPGRGHAHVTTRLLVTACAWAMTKGYAGIVGLCRGQTRVLFARYGLRNMSSGDHIVEWRGSQPYTLMEGTWHDLATATTRLSERLSRLGTSQPGEGSAPGGAE